jgi:hypothetical protein
VRGAHADAEEARRYFDLAGVSPAYVPISAAKIPSHEPLPEREKGRMEGEVYHSTWLGLDAPTPWGMTVDPRDTPAEVLFSNRHTHLWASIGMSMRIHDERSNEETFDDLLHVYEKNRPGLVRSQGGKVETPLGTGVEQRYEVPGWPQTVRVVLIPICHATGSIVLAEESVDEASKMVLDDWRGAIHWSQGADVKACKYLDPR